MTDPKNVTIQITEEEIDRINEALDVFSRPASQSFCHACKGTGKVEQFTPTGKKQFKCRACFGKGWQIYSWVQYLKIMINRLIHASD
jgi:hypothetical protein